MAKYFDRKGLPVTGDQWAALRADATYCQVKAYDNGSVRVEVEWLGKESNPGTFRDFYKLFRLNVWNYDAANQLKRDPVEDGKTFPTEQAAVRAYEEFLVRWTNSHRDDEGDFIEEDNELTPPPPPDPDAPTTDVSEVKSVSLGEDDVGVW